MNIAFSAAALLMATFMVQGQWRSDVRLTNDVLFSSTTFNNARSVAARWNAVYVAWFDERDANREIYFKRSTDGGASWSADMRLTEDAADSKFPALAVSGQTVHVIWEEHRDGNAEIYYKRSMDAGLSWGQERRLTNNSATSVSPSISVSGADVHVVWIDRRNGNHEVYYKRSPDDGISWGDDVRLTFNSAASLYPTVSSSGQEVHAAWEEYRNGPTGEIYYKRSPNGGLNWGPDVRLTTNSANSFSPSIASSGFHVHLVWFDLRDGNSEIYEKHSVDGGLTWVPDARLTNNPSQSEFPCVAAWCSSVHVTWFDQRDGNLEIYYKRSTDAGGTWQPDVRLTNDSFRSTDPTLALDGSAVHVVWTDSRDGNPNGVYDGNYEIYHKSHLDGNVVSNDINGDGGVNIGDVLTIIGNWGACDESCPADINGSGAVDVADLLAAIGSWGPCP